MEPIEYLRILRRRWWIPAAGLILAIVVVLVTTPAKAPAIAATRSYRATNSLLQEPGKVLSGANAPAPKIESIAFFVTAGEVPRRAAEKVGYAGDPAILALQVKAAADTTVGALKIEVTDREGERAAKIANAFADEFVGFLAERSANAYQSQLDSTNKRIESVDGRIRALDAILATLPATGNTQADITRAQRNALVNEYGTLYASNQRLAAQGPPGAGFYSVQPATPIPVESGGFQPPSSRKGRFVILGLLAVLLSIGVAIAVDRIDTRVRSKAEAEAAFNLPVLAEVPSLSRDLQRSFEVSVVVDPESRVAEQYRSLRSHLLFLRSSGGGDSTPVGNDSGGNGHRRVQGLDSYRANGSTPAQVVLVASPTARDGKTTTVANLAACFAEWGLNVLVLGCDFQNPSINRYLGVDDTPGLADMVGDFNDEDEPAALTEIIRPSNIRHVWLAPAGHPRDRTGDLLARMPDCIAEARDLVDIILIDSGPMLAVSDATELLPTCDAVVVVARSGKTTADAAKRTSELLLRFRAPVLGVALLGVPQIGPYPSQSVADTGSWLRRGHLSQAKKRVKDVVAEPSVAVAEPNAEVEEGSAEAAETVVVTAVERDAGPRDVTTNGSVGSHPQP